MAAAVGFGFALAAGAAEAQTSALTRTAYEQPSISDLGQLSIEELADLPVTSVAKRAEPLGQAPAAIYVITREEIERSGALTLPEMLRLAPNLQVFQTSASNYVVTARGFSGNTAAQSFTNQLLVLIDGRSVYTPLYSGVYWDMQDVLPADIDRIEVISGPGAALWGANAVNGVINVITRKASDTQGLRLDVGSGSQETAWDIRYGGKLGEQLAYRLYFRSLAERDTVTAAGRGAGDHWQRPQEGFRVDWTPGAVDVVTLQGDAYEGAEAVPGSADQRILGRNLTGRWTHGLGAFGSLQLQAYYDRTERGAVASSGDFWLDTYDIDAQHSFSWDRHDVVWGGGGRFSRYQINGTAGLQFSPSSRGLNLGNLFFQDTVAVTGRFRVTLGLKLEDDPYSGLSVLPNLRASYTLSGGTLLWASASRAVRSPTPFDRDVVEKVGSQVFLTGNSNFDPVSLTAFEAGVRSELGSRASLSASVYYNVYDNIRSIEVTPVSFTPLHWGNGIKGDTYGLEVWADYRATDWWRLGASAGLMGERFRFKPGSSGLLGVAQVGDDPGQTVKLKSSMTLPHGLMFDAALRYYSPLPDPRVPTYTELNARLAWAVTDRLRLAVSGRNLLNPRRQEFPAPQADAVPRSVFASLSWGF
ncbi:MAG: TonB-dependent receptor plug domain-containing protein [Caulobacteraceae bacterium]